MNARILAPTLMLILVAGCGNEEFSDLREFMRTAGQDSKEKLDPLPEVKPIATFEYRQEDLIDPFMPRNLRPTGGKGTGFEPDMNRLRQPLEEFPLDALRFVGTLKKTGKPLSAVVRDPKNTLHTVKVGDRIGQNFGTISKVTDSDLEIRELMQDGSGEWSESKAMLTLVETGDANRKDQK